MRASRSSGGTVSSSEAYACESAEPVPAAQSSHWWTKLYSYLGVVALAFLLLWLTPLWERVDSVYTGAPFGQYASVFGIGFAVLVGVPLAVVLLMISRIGLRLGFALLAVYAAALAAAPVFLGFFLGSLFWRLLLKKAPCYWAELPIGLLIWRLLSMIPGIGFVVKLVAIALGLGLVTMLLGKGKPAAPAAESAPAPAEPAALPPDSGDAQ